MLYSPIMFFVSFDIIKFVIRSFIVILLPSYKNNSENHIQKNFLTNKTDFELIALENLVGVYPNN